MSEIDYRAVLADLKAKRQDIDAGIVAIERMIELPAATVQRPVSAPPTVQNGHTGSLPSRIVAVLNEHPKRTYRVADMLAALPGVEGKAIRGALPRLVPKKIRKTGRGKYRALPPQVDEQIGVKDIAQVEMKPAE